MGWFSDVPARALGVIALLATVSGCQGRYGHNGLALFPEGSGTRSFFGSDKCSFNSYKDVPTWFCNLLLMGGYHDFGLIEHKQPVSHRDGVNAFLGYDEGRGGVNKGEVAADLKGELAGMELSAIGLEQTVNGAVIGSVTFIGTQPMPDGSGITVWCRINSETVYLPDGVKQCHTGMKLLRDRMVEVHKK